MDGEWKHALKQFCCLNRTNSDVKSVWYAALTLTFDILGVISSRRIQSWVGFEDVLVFEQSADSLTSLKCMNMKQAELEEKKKKQAQANFLWINQV